MQNCMVPKLEAAIQRQLVVYRLALLDNREFQRVAMRVQSLICLRRMFLFLFQMCKSLFLLPFLLECDGKTPPLKIDYTI